MHTNPCNVRLPPDGGDKNAENVSRISTMLCLFCAGMYMENQKQAASHLMELGLYLHLRFLEKI